jgi:hypothetical protein
MLFGLTNEPATFQWYMNKVLIDYFNKFMTENLGKIYLDFQRHVVRGIIDQKDKIRWR